MAVHQTIAGSKLAKLLVAHIGTGGNDPSVSIAKMIVEDKYHPPGEYDLKPIRMMRQFLDKNPAHKLAKVADWSSDLVWMDLPDEVKPEEPITPELQPADVPVEVTPQEPAKLSRPEPEKIRHTRKKMKWDDDGNLIQMDVTEHIK